MTNDNGWQMQVGEDRRLQEAVGRVEQCPVTGTAAGPSIQVASTTTRRKTSRADWISNGSREGARRTSPSWAESRT